MQQLPQGYRVVLIGSGNVAWHFGRALRKAGAEIAQVWSKQEAHARKLAKTLGAEPVWDKTKVMAAANLYLIAVKDDAITSAVSLIPKGMGITIHTAGSISIDAVNKTKTKFAGVIWPLQSLSAGKATRLSQVPLCIEANKKTALPYILQVANTISSNVFELNSKQREAAHLAAVFANNFSNHLFALAEKLALKHKIPFDVLRPLILETAEKVQLLSPAAAQTGPAKRNDKLVLKKQLEMLNDDPQLQKIYRLLSSSIQQH